MDSMSLPVTDTPPISAVPSAFPARTKQAYAVIAGIRTDVTTVFFADKILLTITQDGRLAHWVC